METAKTERKHFVYCVYFDVIVADFQRKEIKSREEWLKQKHSNFLLAYKFYDHVTEILPTGHSKCWIENETDWELLNGESFGSYYGSKTVRYKGCEFVL